MNRSAALKPGQPLRRCTPLRARVGMPRASKPIASQSAKRRAERGARDACRRVVLERNDGRCVRCNLRAATEVHELKRRSQGGDPTDPRGCIGLCGVADGRGPGCHDWVTRNPLAAQAEGFAMWSWEKGRHDEGSIAGRVPMTANSVRSRLSRRQRRILSIIDAGPADGVFSLGIAHELGVPAARLLADLTQMEERGLIASSWEEDTPPEILRARGGFGRLLYRLTPVGRGMAKS